MMIVSDELKGMWKEGAMSHLRHYLKIYVHRAKNGKPNSG
jgi:hypothetical protein